MEINVKILLSRGMEMPAYATDGSAAVDLRAAIDEGTTVVIEPGERALIPTGLAIKKGICLSNSIGVIDSDYRGEICVGLFNTSKEPFTVCRGDRIAQMMFMPVYQAKLLEVASLDETARGAGGFGSTGVK